MKPSKEKIKVFLAHPKGWDEDRISAFSDTAFRLVQKGVELVLGRDDYAQAFDLAGSWDAWCASVPERYSMIFVTGDLPAPGRIGKATANIVEAALRLNVPCLLVFPDGTEIRKITRVSLWDPNDYKQGWECTVENLDGSKEKA